MKTILINVSPCFLFFKESRYFLQIFLVSFLLTKETFNISLVNLDLVVLGFGHITLRSKKLPFQYIFSFAFLVGVLANHHDCSFFLFKRNLILIINQQINHLMQIIFELVFTMNYENIFGNNCMTAKSSLEKASKACILTSHVVLLDQKSSKHAV